VPGSASRNSPGPCRPGRPVIILGGTLGGRMVLVSASMGQRQLLRATVSPAHALCVGYRDSLVVHGKEKVYGSIP